MSPRTRALSLALTFTIVAACGRVISPAPPSSTPALSEILTVAGVPVTVAARAARVLYELSFITKRFGSDSTWGFQSNDSIHARLRYVQPTVDSTRVLVELWSTCRPAPGCLRRHLAALSARIRAEDAPPQ